MWYRCGGEELDGNEEMAVNLAGEWSCTAAEQSEGKTKTAVGRVFKRRGSGWRGDYSLHGLGHAASNTLSHGREAPSTASVSAGEQRERKTETVPVL